MSEKFQNKYRIDTFRLQNWDYRWPASYFVTICTKNREHYFGEVKNGKMILSPMGVIADILWHEIKAHTTNVELDAFVIMPDHIHGIITIKKTSSSGEVSDKVLRGVACNTSDWNKKSKNVRHLTKSRLFIYNYQVL